MKNIYTILSELGITVPEDKKSELDKAVSENYKTVAEFDKKVSRLTEDLNAEKEAHKTALESLKGFEGLGNAADVKKQLEEAGRKIKEAQESAQKQIAERDLKDKLMGRMAQDADVREDMTDFVYQQLIDSGVSLNKHGDLIGYDEGKKAIMAKRPSAFIDKKQEQLEGNKARFTQPSGNGGKPESGKKYSIGELMKMKNANPELDISVYMT